MTSISVRARGFGVLGALALLSLAEPAHAAEAAFVLEDERFVEDGCPNPCETDAKLSCAEHRGCTSVGGFVYHADKRDWLFCPGARHTWIGRSVDIARGAIVELVSDASDPLVFEVGGVRPGVGATAELERPGYHYVSGKGKLVLGDGRAILLPPGSVDEPNPLAAPVPQASAASATPENVTPMPPSASARAVGDERHDEPYDGLLLAFDLGLGRSRWTASTPNAVVDGVTGTTLDTGLRLGAFYTNWAPFLDVRLEWDLAQSASRGGGAATVGGAFSNVGFGVGVARYRVTPAALSFSAGGGLEIADLGSNSGGQSTSRSLSPYAFAEVTKEFRIGPPIDVLLGVFARAQAGGASLTVWRANAATVDGSFVSGSLGLAFSFAARKTSHEPSTGGNGLEASASASAPAPAPPAADDFTTEYLGRGPVSTSITNASDSTAFLKIRDASSATAAQAQLAPGATTTVNLSVGTYTTVVKIERGGAARYFSGPGLRVPPNAAALSLVLQLAGAGNLQEIDRSEFER